MGTEDTPEIYFIHFDSDKDAKLIDLTIPIKNPFGRYKYGATKLRLMKNFIVISLAFHLLFIAFTSIANLQSSLNKDQGLGVAGLALMYVATGVSGMFFVPIVITRLGCKWTMALSMLSFVLYMAANFHAVWATVIPSALLLGLGVAPLWSSGSTYVTTLGRRYAKLTGRQEEDTINRFFGYFFMCYHSSQIWGNLISSLVFSGNKRDDDGDHAHCGASFCPSYTNISNSKHLEPPPVTEIYTVSWVYVSVGLAASLVIALGLDPLPGTGNKGRKPWLALLLGTFYHLRSSTKQKLLVALTVYSGVELAFMITDFTGAFVGCSLGLSSIGFVMICYGVLDAACSFAFGRCVSKTGHLPFFLLAFVVHGGCLVYLLQLKASDSHEVIQYYVIAGLWGVGDAVVQTQTQAVHGCLFPRNLEAAFSNYNLWRAVGFIFAFSLQNYLCTDVKIYLCLGLLTLGILSFLVLETLTRLQRFDSPTDWR